MTAVANDLRNPGTATDAAAITPSDTVGYPVARAIYIGGSGNLVLVTPQGNAVTFTGVVAGTILQVASIRVNATLTTATGLVALL